MDDYLKKAVKVSSQNYSVFRNAMEYEMSSEISTEIFICDFDHATFFSFFFFF